MSLLYIDLKYNLDKINEIISNGKTEKFLTSTTWISPISGQVTLNGTGKGNDGYHYNYDEYDGGPESAFRAFLGGEYSKPSTEIYNVVKDQSYNIYLPEKDKNEPYLDTTKCLFDNKIYLGSKEIYRRSIRDENVKCQEDGTSVKIVNTAPGQDIYAITKYDGKHLTVRQLIDNEPSEPWDARNGSGVGGGGFEGTFLLNYILPNSQQNFWGIGFTITEIFKQSGKGGTGFLEINYPFEQTPLAIFDDLYS